MKIYTRTGDDGSTGLFGGTRIAKDAPRIEAYGTVDELNAALGVARAAVLLSPPFETKLPGLILDDVLVRVQAELFVLGGELAMAPGSPAPSPAGVVSDAMVARLENEIDAGEGELAPLTNFILPGGGSAAAALHVARTVCRRAERAVLALSRVEPVRSAVLVYLNRLSDHLFVLARVASKRAGIADVAWNPRS